ncbi:hypothetical protein D3C72_2171450 [compost metagenome]
MKIEAVAVPKRTTLPLWMGEKPLPVMIIAPPEVGLDGVRVVMLGPMFAVLRTGSKSLFR